MSLGFILGYSCFVTLVILLENQSSTRLSQTGHKPRT